MVLRVTFNKLQNPFMTARLFIKLLGCSRAIIIPEDSTGRTVIVVDTVAEVHVAQKIKSIHAPISYEILPEKFDEIVNLLSKAIKKKTAFITTYKD